MGLSNILVLFFFIIHSCVVLTSSPVKSPFISSLLYPYSPHIVPSLFSLFLWLLQVIYSALKIRS